MNVMKHMEAAFILTLSVAGVASVAADAIAPAQARSIDAITVSAPSAAATAASANIPVVHVTAKRMSTVEKLRSLAEDIRGSHA